ncbi:MAG: hypothetical protein HYU66_08630 [Armatimonadetes bacterium]|nr:hypothetical protein [Armatimonadota bacterium]
MLFDPSWREVGAGAISLWLCAGGLLTTAMAAGAGGPEFEDLGVMVPEAGEPRTLAGPGRTGQVDTLYMLFGNALGDWFMVALDTTTGKSIQYNSSGGEALVTACCVGPDDRVYAGTVGGRLFRFDPKRPTEGIVDLGHVCAGEGYLFALTSGPDGRLYMGSYPGGKLLGYDPAREQFLDFGRAADDEMYTQFVAPLSAEYAYVEAGVVRHRVVRMNLRTGAREEVRLPEGFTDYKGYCNIYLAADGRVNSYLAEAKTYSVIEGTQMRAVTDDKVNTTPYGRRTFPDVTLTYDWAVRTVHHTSPDGTPGTWKFDYTGAASSLFIVAAGPAGCLYGSSYLPLRLFRVDLATREHEDLGNPFPVAGGEAYSITTYSPTQVYAVAYGDDDIILYNPSQPWRTQDGKAAREGTNPLSLGVLGEEQNRCYDSLVGPDRMLYLATTATYGKLGGSLTRLDPRSNTWQVFRNVVPDQALGALSTVPGDARLIAGGSVALGSGRQPGSLGEPKLFLWDTREQRVVYQAAPPVPGMWYILQLEATEEGLLIGTCGRDYDKLHLFVFDPKSRKFIHHHDITGLTGGYGYIAEATGFTQPYHGRMYFTANGRILAVDTRTFAVSVVAEYKGALRGGVLAADPAHGNRMTYFFLTGTDLIAMPLPPEGGHK